MVSMTRRPAARRARPVSVISTTASAISGILASVAPCDIRTSASTPWAARKRLVELGVLGRHPHPGAAGRRRSAPGSPRRRPAPPGWAARWPCCSAARPATPPSDGGLLDPVPPGDAQVEQALGHVFGDLLRAAGCAPRRPAGRRSWPGSPRRSCAARPGRRPRTARGWLVRASPWAGPGAARRRTLAALAAGSTATARRRRPRPGALRRPRRPVARSRAFGQLASRLAISMAAAAASKPLLPALVPARSTACSMVSVVSTPKMIGTPVSSWARWTPAAHWPATRS